MQVAAQHAAAKAQARRGVLEGLSGHEPLFKPNLYGRNTKRKGFALPFRPGFWVSSTALVPWLDSTIATNRVEASCNQYTEVDGLAWVFPNGKCIQDW